MSEESLRLLCQSKALVKPKVKKKKPFKEFFRSWGEEWM